MANRSVKIAVDLDAIRHNYAVAKQLSKNGKLFAVVKANAYGHGAVTVAQALPDADGFAVVTVGEAAELRAASVSQPILILQGAQTQAELTWIHQLGLWPVIHHYQQLQWLKECAFVDKSRPWLKIDSGMGRLGFTVQDATRILAERSPVKWYGALTHFASADATANGTTSQQINAFRNVVNRFKLQTSMANSAGTIAWPESDANWNRPGIMLYGSNPVSSNHQDAHPLDLRPAMRVTAPIISIKHYDRGAAIGYAAAYHCPENMTVAYVAIGYGDGLPRVLDDNASVWLNGCQCSIIGRVSMDSIAIDVRSVENIQLGDEAVIWGPEQSVELLSASANTISYELFTAIKGQRNYF